MNFFSALNYINYFHIPLPLKSFLKPTTKEHTIPLENQNKDERVSNMIGAPCMPLLLDLSNLCRQRLSRTHIRKSREGVGIIAW